MSRQGASIASLLFHHEPIKQKYPSQQQKDLIFALSFSVFQVASFLPPLILFVIFHFFQLIGALIVLGVSLEDSVRARPMVVSNVVLFL